MLNHEVMEVFELKDIKTSADPIHVYPNIIQSTETPLIIDNGSYKCRVGWATCQEPMLEFKNLVARGRKERGKKDGENQVGNDITNIEAVRFQLKTQFDHNIVTQFDVQEQLFDYIFMHLGIDTEGSVNHPIVLTEAFLNPNYSRMLMSELLFECYRVPGACYGVDALLSYGRNGGSTGLVVGCGHHCTHVVPVVGGYVDTAGARRIDIGGAQVTGFAHRLLQLKYPAHFAAITLSRIEELFHSHGFISEEYGVELARWADISHYEANVRRLQVAYGAGGGGGGGLSGDQQKERRRELARRLVEMNARKREEKLAEDEEQLNQLLAVQDLEDEGEEEELQDALGSYQLESIQELKKLIKQIQNRIERTRQKIVAANTSEDSIEEPKQKLMKQMQVPKDEEGFKQWLAGVRTKREELLELRIARRRRRAEMARRGTAASQERMRLISQLARTERADDDFGLRDDDWDVYKVINKEGGDTDSDEESEKLLELEEVLRSHDPMFGAVAELKPGESHQLHVGVERMRAPELLFQPSMTGSMQAGLAETIEYVLRGYDSAEASALCSDVFLTGGCARIPGLERRLVRELREIRPFQSEFRVRGADNPVLDAWLGARDLAVDTDRFRSCLITRQDYLEKGGEYLKEHSSSNRFNPSPMPLFLVDNMPVQATEDQIEVDDTLRKYPSLAQLLKIIDNRWLNLLQGLTKKIIWSFVSTSAQKHTLGLFWRVSLSYSQLQSCSHSSMDLTLSGYV